jgi:hypothetical protein
MGDYHSVDKDNRRALGWNLPSCGLVLWNKLCTFRNFLSEQNHSSGNNYINFSARDDRHHIAFPSKLSGHVDGGRILRRLDFTWLVGEQQISTSDERKLADAFRSGSLVRSTRSGAVLSSACSDRARKENWT